VITTAGEGDRIITAKKVYYLKASDWEPVRPGLTKGITGRRLAPKGTRDMDVTVTKVEPGGEFSLHQDPYHHVIYVVQGKGEASLGDEVYPIGPDTVVEIPAGEVHAYRNTGSTDVVLVTVNIPDER
jgi:quercetin dioxygenase-like cupin family protein